MRVLSPCQGKQHDALSTNLMPDSVTNTVQKVTKSFSLGRILSGWTYISYSVLALLKREGLMPALPKQKQRIVGTVAPQGASGMVVPGAKKRGNEALGPPTQVAGPSKVARTEPPNLQTTSPKHDVKPIIKVEEGTTANNDVELGLMEVCVSWIVWVFSDRPSSTFRNEYGS